MIKKSLPAAAVAAILSAQPVLAQDILACGDDQVRRYAVGPLGAVETWRWTATESVNLSRIYRSILLEKIDDCKPVSGGREILITASTGGVVLLDAQTGAIRFRAHAPMAHSADLLPNNRVAVALSIHDRGDRLEVYDLSRDEEPLFHLPLPSGHGVVWDEGRRRLFALSHDHLQAFALEDWDSDTPSLRETGRWDLPGNKDGHDLSLDPSTGTYLLTTGNGAWRFDPETGGFSPLGPINPAPAVKAVSADAEGRLAWVQSEQRWWAFGFMVAHDQGTLRVTTPDLHLYKVRWLSADAH